VINTLKKFTDESKVVYTCLDILEQVFEKGLSLNEHNEFVMFFKELDGFDVLENIFNCQNSVQINDKITQIGSKYLEMTEIWD